MESLGFKDVAGFISLATTFVIVGALWGWTKAKIMQMEKELEKSHVRVDTVKGECQQGLEKVKEEVDKNDLKIRELDRARVEIFLMARNMERRLDEILAAVRDEKKAV